MGVEIAEPAVRGAEPAARRRSVWVTAMCWVVVLPAALWAVVRAFGLERGFLIPLMAFTPYVAAAAPGPLVLALLLRRGRPAAVAGLALATLAVAVLPRITPGGDIPPAAAGGHPVRVMTANALFGRADPAALVRELREKRVDLLALQEFTPGLADGLTAAGIGQLLPYQELHPEWGAAGSGIYSRFPLSDGSVRRFPGSGFLQVSATVRVPGAWPFDFESVHPCPPAGWGTLSAWRRELAGQHRAKLKGDLRVLAGDFNATLDHAPLRDLINSGYRDAADVVGAGLWGTWGPYDGDRIPPVTIDHILADRRIGVRSVAVHRTPGSDHRKVIAELMLPRGEMP